MKVAAHVTGTNGAAIGRAVALGRRGAILSPLRQETPTGAVVFQRSLDFTFYLHDLPVRTM
jgi:hypothetical protein